MFTSSSNGWCARLQGFSQRIKNSDTAKKVIDGAKEVIPHAVNSTAAAFGSGALTTTNAVYSVVAGVGSSGVADASMAAARRVGNYFYAKCYGSESPKVVQLHESGHHSSEPYGTISQAHSAPSEPFLNNDSDEIADETAPLMKSKNSSSSSSICKEVGKYAAKNLLTATFVGAGGAVALTALSGATILVPAVAYEAISIGSGYIVGALTNKAFSYGLGQQNKARAIVGGVLNTAIGAGTSYLVSDGMQHFIIFLTGNSEGGTSCNNETNSTGNCSNAIEGSVSGSGSAPHPLDLNVSYA